MVFLDIQRGGIWFHLVNLGGKGREDFRSINYDFFHVGLVVDLSDGRSIYIVKGGGACRLQCLIMLSSMLHSWINGINSTKGASRCFHTCTMQKRSFPIKTSICIRLSPLLLYLAPRKLFRNPIYPLLLKQTEISIPIDGLSARFPGSSTQHLLHRLRQAKSPDVHPPHGIIRE